MEINWDTLSGVIISGVISVKIDKGTYRDSAGDYLTSLYKNIDNKGLSIFLDTNHNLSNEIYKFKRDNNAQNFVFNMIN